MRRIRRVVALLDEHVENVLCVGLYIYVIATVFGEVVARYVLGSSILWAEETAIYAFIWLTYISMANLAKHRSHLAFTAIRDALPPTPQLVLLLLADACLLVLGVAIIVYIYQPIADNIMFNQKMTGVDLPLWLATAAVPFGWFLVVVRVVQRAVVTVRNYRSGEAMAAGMAALE